MTEQPTISDEDPEVIAAGVDELARTQKKLRHYANQISYALSSPASTVYGQLHRVVDEYNSQKNKFEAQPLTESFDQLMAADEEDPETLKSWRVLATLLNQVGRVRV